MAETRWKWVDSVFCKRVETLESLSKLVDQGVSFEVRRPRNEILYWRESGERYWHALAPVGSPEMWVNWADEVITEKVYSFEKGSM